MSDPLIKCHRCEKPIAHSTEEGTYHANIITAETELEVAKLKDEFAKKYCVCNGGLASLFTSSQQPPNLDDIERRMK
jgi:hypothetical protein